ncbi:EamA family transporter [Myxococcus llanfairpwllgwyngyllgogerychwyrndrobwllllantysiliogogogochensis]|uniref:EamA family transporter n=1 Tax=Myxococcus llanfairpwllgwyngyllgogerychwyrndrobwllllantysiliogogogochensis TaxID=2590453 RepID=A0A540X006_9BACT|nr:DMT family transporter [Myxococcus llanfairpwllgwyngyllgogerychwyrndrobwllllantysiliogogogochensis]TQF14064.1 EamA family transporter [Myxococcus llanfairpwllgwyngyllgogerychwyrndrobwllllantysiliogogogochensis]
MRHFAMVAAGATLWGCWSLFLRPAGLSWAQNALLALIAMSLPVPFLLRGAPWRDKRATAALLVVGLADAANISLFFAAMKRGPVSVAVLTHYLAPLLLALAAPWVLGERRSFRALVAAPVTLLGLVLLIGRPDGTGGAGMTAALGAGSALFYAAIVLGTKAATRAYSPVAVASLHAPVSAGVLLLIAGVDALPPALDGATLQVLAGGAVCGLLGTCLFNAGLRHVPTAAAGALTYLEPLTASLVGWAVFAEALSPVGVAGGLLVLAAGVWVASERRGAASGVPLPSAAP